MFWIVGLVSHEEFFRLFFPQLLSCGNSLTLKTFAKRVQATIHDKMTSS